MAASLADWLCREDITSRSSEMDLNPASHLAPPLPMPGPGFLFLVSVGGTSSSSSSSSSCIIALVHFLGTFFAIVGHSCWVVWVVSEETNDALSCTLRDTCGGVLNSSSSSSSWEVVFASHWGGPLCQRGFQLNLGWRSRQPLVSPDLHLGHTAVGVSPSLVA